MNDLIGHSITYRVAAGPRAGQKVFALQTVPARAAESRAGVAQSAGFSLHAGIGVEADQRAKLERLARYVSRPPVAVERLTLTAQGQVRYRLKTPYRDGTTHLVLEPVDFMARLAALVPLPRKHLTRLHGVFAPHAAVRAAVTPAGRGPGAGSRAGTAESPTPRHVAMTWARRLQRVFGIEIERCARCGGRLTVIASIEEPALIARILAHRRERRMRRLRRLGRGRRRRACGSESGCRRRARCGRRARERCCARLSWERPMATEPRGVACLPGTVEARGTRILAGAPPRTARRYTRRQQKGPLSVLSAAAGYNLRWLLRAIAKLGIGPAFLCLLQMALLPATVLRSVQTSGNGARLAG